MTTIFFMPLRYGTILGRKSAFAPRCQGARLFVMKLLFLVLVSTFTFASPRVAKSPVQAPTRAAQSISRAPEPKMEFAYEPVEGEEPSSCVHERIRDLPDWDVVCETPYGKKTYSAHVIVREYPRQGATGLEILYWVSEPGDTPTSPHKFHSTSALVHLRGSTSLDSFSLSQGVENDMALLTLRLRMPSN